MGKLKPQTRGRGVTGVTGGFGEVDGCRGEWVFVKSQALSAAGAVAEGGGGAEL